MLGPAIAVLQRHAVLVERDNGGIEIELLLKRFSRVPDFVHVGQGSARRQARFEAIRRDRGAAVVFAVIVAADRIGEDLEAASAGGADDRAKRPGVQTPLS